MRLIPLGLALLIIQAGCAGGPPPAAGKAAAHDTAFPPAGPTRTLIQSNGDKIPCTFYGGGGICVQP